VIKVFAQRGSLLVAALIFVGIGIFLLSATAKSEDRYQLFPKLQNGDALNYESHARLNRYVQTKSNVKTMFEPKPLEADFSMNLRFSVDDYHALEHRPIMAAETLILPARAGEHNGSNDSTPAKPLKVRFAIGGNGNLAQADGLDDLDAGQRMAWQFWIAQFAFAWTFPASGVRPGERWKSEEVEQTPTPIARLVWERETTYVQDEQCPTLPSEQCAVFLVTANLRQKSNRDDATPEDYKLHQLKTSGSAKGTNQTVLYISRKTGLLVRATEDLQQSLDVTIAKTDKSNQVQYLVDVTSHLETRYLPAGQSSAP
jgi:hypothetical protein